MAAGVSVLGRSKMLRLVILLILKGVFILLCNLGGNGRVPCTSAKHSILLKVLGVPEARFARVRELSGHKYQDDYKIFIDDTAIDLPATKLQRPLFSWDFVPSATETDSVSTVKPSTEAQDQDNEKLNKNDQTGSKGKLRKNRNGNELHASDNNREESQLLLQEHLQEFNTTNGNNKVKDSSRSLKGRKRKNKNRKNKPGHRRTKPGKYGPGKNKKRKSGRKMRRGHKPRQDHQLRPNDLTRFVHLDEQVHTAEGVSLESVAGFTSSVARKADNELVTQVQQNTPSFSDTQKVNETNFILEEERNLHGMSETKDSESSSDNVLLPILHTDVIGKEHNRVNSQKNMNGSAFQQSVNASLDIRETESATVELDINQSSDTYVKFVDENNSTKQQSPGNSNSRSELENVNGSFQESEVKEYDALNEIVGDVSCLAGTFLPAPPTSNAAIKYIRTQLETGANLVAEYECEPNHHLENPKIFQVICSERKWMGTVPSCVPDLPVIENRAACYGGKGSCDHMCEIVGNNTICTCYKGFRLENGVCRDINECEVENGGCENGCRNTPGSHHCTCPVGLRLADNRMTCIDINECLLRNGHGPCQDSCHNKWGGYECSCRGITGTRLAPDHHTCQDIDECADGTAGCSHTCLNTFGSAFCLCPSGFMLGDDWKTCQDIDECSYDELQSEQCEFGCVNTVGSYHCLGPQNDDNMPSPTTEVMIACPYGFYLDVDGKCKDVDECKEKTSGCEQGCLNTKGSFQCYCGLGFKLAPNNRTCVEAKEAVCPPLDSPSHGYWECARHLIRTKKSKLPWMKRTRVVNHAGAICQLKCPPGFVLEGEYRKTCGQDSKWKGPEDGTCVRKLDYMFNVILKA